MPFKAFILYLLSSKHCVRCFTYVVSNVHKCLWALPHLTNEDAEAQKIQVTLTRGLKPCLRDPTVPPSTTPRAAPPITKPETVTHPGYQGVCTAALLSIVVSQLWPSLRKSFRAYAADIFFCENDFELIISEFKRSLSS